MHPHQLFDEAVRSMGLGQRLADYAPERTGMIEKIINWSYKEAEGFRQSSICVRPLPPLIIDIVDNPTINARATQYKGTLMICLFSGSIKTIDYMFKRLLCERRFMPGIGNIHIEQETLPVIPLSHNYNDLETALRNSGYHMDDLTPRDPIRQEVAGLMYFISIANMIGHEFSHLQAGHVDYITNGMKWNNYIDECVSPVFSALNFAPDIDMALKYQALEMDADNAATYLLYKYLCDLHQKMGGGVPGLRHLPNLDTFLIIISIACSALFRILQPYPTPPVAQWGTRFHPPIIVRRLIMLAAAQTYLHMDGSLIFPRGTMLPVDKIINTLDVVNERVWGGRSAAVGSHVTADDISGHIINLKRIAKTMSVSIRKYSYTKFGDNECF